MEGTPGQGFGYNWKQQTVSNNEKKMTTGLSCHIIFSKSHVQPNKGDLKQCICIFQKTPSL